MTQMAAKRIQEEIWWQGEEMKRNKNQTTSKVVGFGEGKPALCDIPCESWYKNLYDNLNVYPCGYTK